MVTQSEGSARLRPKNLICFEEDDSAVVVDTCCDERGKEEVRVSTEGGTEAVLLSSIKLLDESSPPVSIKSFALLVSLTNQPS